MATVFVIKASIVMRESLGHNRNSTGVTKDHDVRRPIMKGHVSVLCGGHCCARVGCVSVAGCR